MVSVWNSDFMRMRCYIGTTIPLGWRFHEILHRYHNKGISHSYSFYEILHLFVLLFHCPVVPPSRCSVPFCLCVFVSFLSYCLCVSFVFLYFYLLNFFLLVFFFLCVFDFCLFVFVFLSFFSFVFLSKVLKVWGADGLFICRSECQLIWKPDISPKKGRVTRITNSRDASASKNYILCSKFKPEVKADVSVLTVKPICNFATLCKSYKKRSSQSSRANCRFSAGSQLLCHL